MTIKLFVEGIADDKFLRDYISEKYGVQLAKEDIIRSEGWSSIKSLTNGEYIKNAMLKNSDNNGKNLLIFDADEDFSQRLQEISDWQIKHKLNFDIFLWPNNKDSGDLETLLEKIICPVNAPIFDCWQGYEDCLNSKQIDGRTTPLTTPAKKTKIYGYLEALLGKSKSEKSKLKEKNRDYKNPSHWDLNAKYLADLRSFLDPHFQRH